MDGKILCLMMNLIVWKTHSKTHCLYINVQGIEPYDLTFQCSRQLKEKIHIRTHYQFQTFIHKWLNVYLMNFLFHIWNNLTMHKELLLMIYCKKKTTTIKPFHTFFTRGAWSWKKFTLLCIIYKTCYIIA